MIHSFDVDHALKYGVNESIMISNFQFWILKNKANGTNFHDGRTWTYNSVNAFKEIFPYWNNGQIRRCLESLVNQKVLVKGDYNKNRYERTLWYAFYDESILLNQQIHLSKTANGIDENDKCITDTIPNNKQDIKPDIKPKAKKKKEKVEFVPPSIDQLKEYFVERGFPIEMLDEVYDHYNNANWHKVNDMPVIDWKRTISTNWKRSFEACRQRKLRQHHTNVNRGNSQPQVDPAKIINYGKGNGSVVYSEKYNVYYEPIQNGQPPKEVTDLIYLDQGNHGHYGEYVKWMLMNDRQPMPPEDTRYFPADFNFEKFISEQKAILANSNQ